MSDALPPFSRTHRPLPAATVSDARPIVFVLVHKLGICKGVLRALPTQVLSQRSVGHGRVSMTWLIYLTVCKFRIVVETRGNRARIVRNRCVPVCEYRAGYFGLGLAQLQD